MLIRDIHVRRIDRDLVFERDGYAIALRPTVGDRATLTYSFEGDQIGEATGVRMDPEVIAELIMAALGED